MQFLYLYPLSFQEFLKAVGKDVELEWIEKGIKKPATPVIHEKLLGLIKDYMLIGGMPEVVAEYRKARNILNAQKIQRELINSFRQDFRKYAKERELPHVEQVFSTIPRFVGQKFKYSHIRSDIRSSYLADALQLLAKAGVVHIVYHSSANGTPLGAEKNSKHFKVIFLDVGLGQCLLDSDTRAWLVESVENAINAGSVAEQLVGQELVAYGNPESPAELFYWHREERTSTAEVDYLLQCKGQILPIEVKSGSTGRLKSLKIFMDEKKTTKWGVRISTRNYSAENRVLSLPHYAVQMLFRGKFQ